MVFKFMSHPVQEGGQLLSCKEKHVKVEEGRSAVTTTCKDYGSTEDKSVSRTGGDEVEDHGPVLVSEDQDTLFDEEYPAMMKNFSKTSSLLFVLGTIMVSLGIILSVLPSTGKALGELQAYLYGPPIYPPPSGEPSLPIGAVIAIRSVSSGNYLDGKDKNFPHDNQAHLTNRDPTGDKFLHWIIEQVEGNLYALRSFSSGFYLDGRDPSYANREGAVIMSDGPPHGDPYLQWTIEEVDGNFALKSVSSGLYLDGRAPLNTGNQLMLTGRPPQGDKYLQWTFSPQLPIGVEIAIHSVSSGNYLDGGIMAFEPFLIRSHYPEHEIALHWIIEEVGDNLYAVKSSLSGFYLDGRDPSYANREGAVIMYDGPPHFDIHLQWTIEEVDGNFALKSVSSRLYLDGRDTWNTGPHLMLTDRPPQGDKYLQWTFTLMDPSLQQPW